MQSVEREDEGEEAEYHDQRENEALGEGRRRGTHGTFR